MRKALLIIVLLVPAICLSGNNEFWTIIPGECVGKITAQTTEGELVKIFGKENVQRAEVPMGEDSIAKCTIIYKGTPNELEVIWSKPYKTPIKRIILRKMNSQWRTLDNIRVGTSMEIVERLNGKPFVIKGFEWDYPGLIYSWNGGKLSKKYKIGDKFAASFTYSKNLSEFPATEVFNILGNKKISTNKPIIKKLDLYIDKMAIIF